MRGKSLALLVLALGCGLVASIGITQVMAKRHNEPAAALGETQAIFVAMKDIGLGDVLNSQVLKLEQWPKDKAPAGAIARIEDVEGRRTRAKLYAGEPILENKLFGKGVSEQGADALIPKGFRVVSIKVDAVSGGGGLLLPGSRVDVLVHLIHNPQRGIPETSTRTILQDVKVFAVNDQIGLEEEKDSKSIAAKTISLLVTPAQAAKVTLATELGKIRLIMRSPEDDQHAEGAVAMTHELLGRSEKGDAQKEGLVEDAPPGQPESGDGFLDFLNRMRQKAADEGAPANPRQNAAEPSNWQMRILAGREVNDVLLETPKSPSGAPSSFELWKRSAAAPTSPAEMPEDSPQTDAPPTDLTEALDAPEGPEAEATD